MTKQTTKTSKAKKKKNELTEIYKPTLYIDNKQLKSVPNVGKNIKLEITGKVISHVTHLNHGETSDNYTIEINKIKKPKKKTKKAK